MFSCKHFNIPKAVKITYVYLWKAWKVRGSKSCSPRWVGILLFYLYF